MKKNLATTEKLIEFIRKSPTSFHAVAQICSLLEEDGFVPLAEGGEWKLEYGKKYYVTRNRSSVIAFAMPEENGKCSFMITASHTDSPTFKLKNLAEAASGSYVKLNAEAYGGMILSTWLDRPLSIAGRVVVREEDTVTTKLVHVDRDLCLIPNVAIHMNRKINDGYAYNLAVDMMPLIGQHEGAWDIDSLIADEIGVEKENVIAKDLYLYPRTPASVWGGDGEFFSSPRIDNLQCAYATLRGFLSASQGEVENVSVYASFDNEETGSGTKQGAASTFLADVLERICDFFGCKLRGALASSFMVSADNAHACHPNHPELTDPQNVTFMNQGVVIKSNASQKYTTDAISAAIFAEICKRAGVPIQWYANKSDVAGGSTLGSIANRNVPVNTVDIGLAQLSMHSAYETAGVRDTEYLITATEEFYRAKIECLRDGEYRLK